MTFPDGPPKGKTHTVGSRIPRPRRALFPPPLPVPSPAAHFLPGLVKGPRARLLSPEDRVTVGLGQQSLAVYL